jgi:acyl-CoA thioesterase-1
VSFLRVFLCFISLVVFGGLIGCDRVDKPTDPEKKSQPSSPLFGGTIVCVGDSLTEGLGVDEDSAYPAQLKQRLEKDGYSFKVVNAGISGETSSGTLSRINWILTLNPDIVILETGANDGFRGLDPQLIQKNITAIVQSLKEKDVIVVLAGMEIVRNLGNEYTTAFREVYAKIAREEEVILIPFFLKGVAGNPRLNQTDGLHPTAEGYQEVTKTIYPYVIQAIKIFEGTS